MFSHQQHILQIQLVFRWGLHGLNLFVQHSSQMLDWIEIWGLYRPSQHLKKKKLSHVPHTIPEQILQCGREHYSPERVSAWPL